MKYSLLLVGATAALTLNLKQIPGLNFNGRDSYQKYGGNKHYVNLTQYLIDSPQEYNKTVTKTKMFESKDPPPKTQGQLWNERVIVMKAKEAQFAKEREQEKKEQAKFNAEREARFAKRRAVSRKNSQKKSMIQKHSMNKETIIMEKLGELESLKSELQYENERLNQYSQAKFLKNAFVQKMTDDKIDDDSYVQLSQSIRPHEQDTEDIADEVNPSNYDSHHSKAWNDAVNEKALEYENEMKIEDNIQLSKQKTKDEQRKRLEAYEAQKKKDKLEEELYQLEKKQNKLKTKKKQAKKVKILNDLPLYDFDSDEVPIDQEIDVTQSVDRQQIVDSQWDDLLQKQEVEV